MKINAFTIFFAIFSLVVGAYLNDLVYKRNNEKLLAELKAELAANNVAKAGLSGQTKIEAEIRENEIQAQINLLEKII